MPADSLEARINRMPTMALYKECLDAGGFVPAPSDTLWPMEGKEEILVPIIKKRSSMFGNNDKIFADTEAYALPQVDIAQEVKDGVRRAIKYIHRANLFELPILSTASRYAGPGNAIYVDDSWYHQFRGTPEYREYATSQNPEHRSTDPLLPISKSQRDRFFQLSIGGHGLRSKMLWILEVAQEAGISLSAEDALKWDLTTGAAHEYGHAIKGVFEQQGVDTRSNAKRLGFIRQSGMLGAALSLIHEEHFARAFDNLGFTYLREAGMSKQDSTLLQAKFEEEPLYQVEAGYAFIKYAQMKGLSAKEIRAIDVKLPYFIEKAMGGNRFIWNLMLMLAYKARPYTFVQIQQMTSQPIS